MEIKAHEQISKKHYLVMLFLFVFSFVIYGKSLSQGFVNYDDPALAYENKLVKSRDLKQIFTTMVAEDYIPLTVASYALDYSLFGMDPFYFHLHNVLLHSFNVLLVFWLIWLISSGNFLVSVTSAFLFAAHPLHVESVAWIAERKDVLSAFFSLASLIFYWKYLNGRRRALLYCMSLLCLALALFAKFMAVSLPAIILIFEIQKRESYKKTLLRILPFALLALVFTSIHLKLHNSVAGPTSIDLGRGLDSLVFYLSKTFFPRGLSAFYERDVVTIERWEYIFAAVVAVVVGNFFYWFKNLRGPLSFGLLFFLATLFPVMQIVPFGNLFAFADRFMYLPSLGLFYALSVLLMASSEKVPPRFKRGVLALVLTLGSFLSALTSARVEVWESSMTLWKDAVEKSPNSAVAHNNLGQVKLDAAKWDEAISELQRAIQIKPDYAEPYVNLGLAYLDLKKIAEAEKALRIALEINPKLPRAHVNLALVLEAQNRLELAQEHYLKALELDPELVPAKYNLGVIYYRLKQHEKALAAFREALNMDPYLAEGLHAIGVILLEKGDIIAAISSFETAAKQDLLFSAPRVQLMNIYKQQGKLELANQQVEEIQKIQKELQSRPPTRSRWGP